MTQKTKRQTVSCRQCQADIVRNVRLEKPQMFFCGMACKGAYQRTFKPISREECVAMYEAGMSCVDIGKVVNRDPKSVWNWLRDWRVPTRSRGADDRQHFAKGHKMNVGRKMPESQKEKIRQARIKDGSKGLFKPNGDHILKGRKGKDHPSWRGGSTPLRQAFYASDEWKAACVAVWHRDDAKCQNCGLDHRAIDRSSKRFHVHHIASFARYPELRAAPDNLILLCDTCHRWAHSRANADRKFIKGE